MSVVLKQNETLNSPDMFISFDCETYKESVEVNKTTKLKNNTVLINQHFLSFGYAFFCKRIDNSQDIPEYKRIDELLFTKDIKDIENYNKKLHTNYEFGKQVFTDWLLRKVERAKTLYIYAHNIAYDFRVCIDDKLLKEAGYKLKTSISKNVFIYKYIKKNYAIIFLSTTNYFRTSLKELGKTFNLEKLDFSIDEEGLNEIKNITDRAKTYCYRDVEIVEKVVIDLIKFMSYQCKFSYTIASVSFNIFRHGFYDCEKSPVIMHKNPEFEKLERLAYYGGRTECFKIGIFHDIYKLDINSMYPSVMLNNDYPIELVKHIKETINNKKLLHRLIQENKYLIIAKIKVKIDYPKTPYHENDKPDKKFLFPIGEFTSFLCQPEIMILEEKEIIEVYDVLIYNKYPVFTKFVSHFYELRLKYKTEKNEVMQYFCKIVLNSLYGKFAQKTKKEYKNSMYDGMITTGYLDFYDNKEKILHKLKFIKGECFEIVDDILGFNTFVPISAFVTSYSRVLLYNLIKLVKKFLIYVDTDSLFVTKEGYDILNNLGWIDKNILGKLKLEDILPKLEIRNLKDYSLEEQNKEGKYELHHKIKGIKKQALEDAIKNKENISEKKDWNINRIIGYNESLRYFDLILGDIDEPKNLRRTYEKGIVDKNGNVHPIIINEI